MPIWNFVYIKVFLSESSVRPDYFSFCSIHTQPTCIWASSRRENLKPEKRLPRLFKRRWVGNGRTIPRKTATFSRTCLFAEPDKQLYSKFHVDKSYVSIDRRMQSRLGFLEPVTASLIGGNFRASCRANGPTPHRKRSILVLFKRDTFHRVPCKIWRRVI